MTERDEMEELMKGIDGKVWACKGEGCYKDCDSHPCLIEKGMRTEVEGTN